MTGGDVYGLARLDTQGLIGSQLLERQDDAVELPPVTGGPTAATVNDELVGDQCHPRVQVVHEHPERGLGVPGLAVELCTCVSVNVA